MTNYNYGGKKGKNNFKKPDENIIESLNNSSSLYIKTPNSLINNMSSLDKSFNISYSKLQNKDYDLDYQPYVHNLDNIVNKFKELLEIKKNLVLKKKSNIKSSPKKDNEIKSNKKSSSPKKDDEIKSNKKSSSSSKKDDEIKSFKSSSSNNSIVEINLDEINLCKKWHKIKLEYPKKLFNPITNYNIKKYGPKYNELEKLCKKYNFTSNELKEINIERNKKSKLTKPLNNVLCKIWKKDKDINPITNRHIQESGIIYKEIKNNCI